MQRYLGVLRQLKDFDENLTREIAARAYQEQERVKLEVHVFNALTKNNRVENCDVTKIHIYESLGLVSIFRNNQNSPVAKIQPISVNWWGNIGTVHSIQMLPNLFANLERFIWSHRSITVLICPHQFTLTGWFFSRWAFFMIFFPVYAC